MSLRTRLVLVFLFLAVVPLGALVLYSYSSSLAAVRRAAEVEADELTQEMEARMERIATSLDQRVQSLSDLAPETWMAPDREDLEVLNRRIAEALGEQAAFLDSLEFVPAAAPPAPGGGEEPAAANERTARAFVLKIERENERRVMRWIQQVAGGEGPPSTRTLAEFPVGAVLESLTEDLDLPSMDVEVAISIPSTIPSSAAPGTETPSLEASPAPEPPAPASPPRPAGVLDRGLRLAGLAFEKAELGCDLRHEGELVGHLKARLKAKELLWRVLAETDRQQGEIPFALDRQGELYTADEADRPRLEKLVQPLRATSQGATARKEAPHEGPQPALDDGTGSITERDGWIVVTREDPNSGIRFGLAHPMADSFDEVRRTAATNFGWGLAVIGLCFGGILPLSRRMTRNLQALSEGTEKLARGDLETRVPVRTQDEVGRLAANFNRMAEQIRTHQQELLEQERLRKEQELQRRLLEAENHRKSEELEEARDFQLSLLPKELPRVPGLELAVGMTTATEVGGDYYDAHTGDGRPLTLVVGDATGHGTAAGTMVTVVKSLFIARGGETTPGSFLSEAGQMIRRMELGRRAMALVLLAFEDPSENGCRLTLSSAGMPPVLRHSAGEVQEIALEGLPLGASATIEGVYEERTVDLVPGDTLLVATDGFAELLDGRGEPLGYERARDAFARAVAGADSSQQVLDRLTVACRDWAGDRALADDVTFLVVRVG